MQGVWEKDEIRKDDSFNTFEVCPVRQILLRTCTLDGLPVSTASGHR